MFIDSKKLPLFDYVPQRLSLSVCKTCVSSSISFLGSTAGDQVALRRAGWFWSEGCGGTIISPPSGSWEVRQGQMRDSCRYFWSQQAAANVMRGTSGADQRHINTQALTQKECICVGWRRFQKVFFFMITMHLCDTGLLTGSGLRCLQPWKKTKKQVFLKLHDVAGVCRICIAVLTGTQWAFWKCHFAMICSFRQMMVKWIEKWLIMVWK